MISRIEVFLRRLRRLFSRSYWLTRVLRLPESIGHAMRPGLLMVQVDGLSETQLERALAQGEMPFLKRLIEREHYQVQPMYSGLPSGTPAVQAELFYGVKTAVPAFSFCEREHRRIVRMYEPGAAEQVEARLRQLGEGLLAGGSAYADNFTGGADEAHFCPTSLGWGPGLRGAGPGATLLLLASHLYSVLRIAVLFVLETALALFDFVRGLSNGRDFLRELKFVPTRVAICILLRELCVIGGKIDINRGLPIIHINLLGYDEQAHRRGPESAFAHWTLKGIDDAIGRLWRSAHRAPLRHYEVWIYSDHGQTRACSYASLHGYPFGEAVERAFAVLDAQPEAFGDSRAESVQTQRVRFLGGRRFQRLFAVFGVDAGPPDEQRPQVAALGPVGFVYSPRVLAAEDRAFLARELVATHHVPVVITRDGQGDLCARTADGEFRLPADTAALVGAGHPHLKELRSDLAALCLHPDAGELVVLGWRHGAEPVTFAMENGAHGGTTPDETGAFCLLPADTALPRVPHDYLRPADLRDAALQHLGRGAPDKPPGVRRERSRQARQLRVMTWNVHSCIGMDGKVSARRIARVIARASPDIIALQELDVGRARTEGEDQAHAIARCLEMDHHFHPAMHLEEERYGDAILSYLPMRLVRAGSLPGFRPGSRREPRGALWVAVDFDGMEVQVLNTHLGLSPRERMHQVEALLGEEWLGDPRCQAPVILCGDFNATPSSRVCRRLRQRLDDVQVQLDPHRPGNTFSSRFPAARIDHIFVAGGLRVTGIEIQGSQLARVASDHLPLLASVEIE